MATLHGNRRQDASVNPAAKTLPNGATTADTASIDLGVAHNAFLADVEFFLTTPTLTTAQLGDGDTMTYKLQESTDDTTFTDVMTVEEAKQTGAGGNGDTGDTHEFRLPSDIARYIRVRATNSSAKDASGASMTFGALFK